MLNSLLINVNRVTILQDFFLDEALFGRDLSCLLLFDHAVLLLMSQMVIM